MLHQMTRPLSPQALLAILAAIVAFMAVYCLAYNALQGRTETLANAVAWPIVNILPFAIAAEAGKRIADWSGRALMLSAMLAVSLALDTLMSPSFDLAFELLRRIPALLLVPILIGILDWVATNHVPKQSAWNGELPLLAEQIDYVRAAGNYVELHGLGRTILHRTTMAALCEQLASSEFVRVHRSVLVRMSAVRRWLPGHVEMLDGSVYRIGARYRASIADLTK